MTKLETYLKQKNSWNSIFGGKTFNVKKLTSAEAKEVFEMIDCDMSPENLCCDGEASRAHIKSRLALYQGAINDLKRLGFSYSPAY